MSTKEQSNEEDASTEDETIETVPFAFYYDPNEEEKEQPAELEQHPSHKTVHFQTNECDDKKKHERNERKGGMSYFPVLINFIKSLIGAGFLSLPMAFREGGISGAFALLIVSALLNCYCMMQLVENAQFHYRRLNVPYLSYGNLAKEACKFSFPWVRKYKLVAKRLVNASVLLLEFGFCSTYYVFIAKSLEQELCHIWHVSIRSWILLLFVPMVLLTFIRSMRLLSFFSLAGNVLMLFSSSYILYVLATYLLGPHKEKIPEYFGTFFGMLIASSTMIFAFEAQTLVLPLEKKLKRPQQMMGFGGILFVGIFISTIVYGSVGLLGYLSYGNNVKGSVTENLEENLGTIVVTVALCLSICSSFLLQMYVIIDVLWARVARIIIAGENFKKTNAEKDAIKRWWQLPSGYKLWGELLFRTLMVTVCFTFAVAVPSLDNIIPLVGSTSGMLLAFVYPSLIDLFTFVPHLLKEGHRQKAYLRLGQNILFASIGLFGMVAGLIASIHKLIYSDEKGSDACSGTIHPLNATM